MSNGLGRKILACAGFLLLSTVRADIIYPVPERLPPIPSEETKSCAELDQKIVSVLPLTYPSRPGIYEDPINGVGFWVGSMFSGGGRLAYGLLGYSAYRDHEDRVRIHSAQQQIQVLRRRKAHQHCFEDDYFTRGR